MNSENYLSKGTVERIGLDNPKLKHYANNNKVIEINENIKNHEEAVQLIIKMLTHPIHGIIKDMSKLTAVGHRIAHGAEKLFESVEINDQVIQIIKDNIGLAPIHMSAMVKGVEVFKKLLPNIPMVAIFDTAFHQTMPEKAFLYAIPFEYYLKYGIRRYGFHGQSHKYVSIKAAQLINKPYESIKTVSCHLGNGSSIAAINKGKSVDTSMGFTPIVGVPMGTRCGDIDVSIVGYLMENEKLSYNEVENILNRQSGFLGLSGASSDCRDVMNLADEGNERAKIAIDVFCYNIKKYIGAYAAAMGGLDCIVFTGGIGENSSRIREEVCQELEFLGVKIDQEKNSAMEKNRGQDAIISLEDSKVKVCLINTNEELMMARETMKVVTDKNKN
jgi:acetate kinase